MNTKIKDRLSFLQLAKKIASLLKKNTEHSMQAVRFKLKSSSYHYSPSHERYVSFPQTVEIYLLPIKAPDEGKVYLYTPYLHRDGMIVLVNEDLIEILGDN